MLSVGHFLEQARTNPGAYLANLDNVLGYVLKGCCKDAVVELGLERHEDTGQVVGKRVGWSQNIGRAAQTSMITAGMRSS